MSVGLTVVELMGGVFGLVGSVVLAIPAFLDLSKRDFWDQLRRLESVKGASADDTEALRGLLLDDLLGGYRLHMRCAVWGGGFLAFAFALVAAVGVARLTGG